MRPILLLTTAAVAVSARGRTICASRRVWNLPPPTTSQESVAAFVQRVPRGGGDYYDDKGYSNNDDPIDSYNQQYGNDDHYGDHQADDYQDDRRYYEDRYDDRRQGGVETRKSPFQVPDIIKKGDRRIGLALLGTGAVLTMLGISLFFNKALMRLGNLLFMAGVPMTIGPGRTAGYFLQPQKARATGCLALGIVLVFVGHPVIGIALEAFGLMNLFGNMFPFALVILKQMPIIGPILSRKPNPSENNQDRGRSYQDDRDYYDDRQYYDDVGDDKDEYNQKYY